MKILFFLSLLLFLSFLGVSQTNNWVTEYYLANNFTPKAGITPGTDNTLWMSCDQILARYNVTISGATTTGDRWPSQNQLTSACPSVGSSYQGGIVGYLFQSGDAGYVSGECHGLIISPVDIYYLEGMPIWGCSGLSISTSSNLGQGASNTSAIIAACGDPSIAAKLCDTYSNGVYSDWFLPSVVELENIICALHSAGFDSYFQVNSGSVYYWYWSSTQSTNTSAMVAASNNTCYVASALSKTSQMRVKAVRYF